jgi:hypothetical protein
MGIFGPILICSILGGLVVAPSLYHAYLDQGSVRSSLDNIVVTNYRTASYQLSNIAIAAGSGMVFGLIAGLINLIFRNPEDDFEYRKLVSPDFGLYTPVRVEGQPDIPQIDTNNILNANRP